MRIPFHRIDVRCFGTAATLAFALATLHFAGEAFADDSATRAEEMQGLVHQLHGFKVSDGQRTEAPLSDRPLRRWSEPTREASDGALWIFGTAGRPAAVVALELYPDPNHHQVWAYEFVSLSTGPVEVSGGSGFDIAWSDLPPPRADGSLLWTPAVPGVTFQSIPGSPAPGNSENERMRQMKALSERFSAEEYYAKTKQTDSLRLLARPLHRYHDVPSGIVDGAIFEFAHGTNPEVFLLIEAQKDGADAATWRFAAAQLTRAGPTLRLDQRAVWNKPYVVKIAPNEAYYSARRVRNSPLSSSRGSDSKP